MFERIDTSYFLKIDLCIGPYKGMRYCNKWRTLDGQKYQHHKPISTEQMKIILFDSARCVAKSYLAKKKKKITCCYNRKFDITKQQNCDKGSTVKHNYFVTAKENCCVGGLHQTRRNVEKHWRELRLTQIKTKLNIVLRNCGEKYGWIMI